MKLFSLAQIVFEGGEVELTAEQISLIKKRIDLIYPTLIVGTCYSLLEQMNG